MKVITRVAICILSLVVIHCHCFARYGADTTQANTHLDSVLNAVDSKFQNKAQGDSEIKVIIGLAKYDTTISKAYNQYLLFGLTHRQKTLQWNLNSSIIIFWIVIFLVFSGIVFAGLQFYRAMYSKKTEGINTDLNTQLEANIRGIKVSSPVLGVIILTLSLLFFYLYLVYVYPINEIF